MRVRNETAAASHGVNLRRASWPAALTAACAGVIVGTARADNVQRYGQASAEATTSKRTAAAG